MTTDNKCRLCGGETRIHFSDLVLRKYSCEYMLCNACGSLQTERPYWLEEAYGSGSIADSDSGVFLRGMNNLCVIYLSAWLLGMPKRTRVLDFGGGNGLLCRMMRDIGDTPDIICSFEVAEHFPDPRIGMAAILGRGATTAIVGTEIYREQGKDWWYISPHSGQHVFFYSHNGMRILADQNGYIYERVGSMHYFVKRPLTRMQSSLLWRALSPGVLRWVRAYLMLRLSDRFANADAQMALLARG
jgi:hypothetical protein